MKKEIYIIVFGSCLMLFYSCNNSNDNNLRTDEKIKSEKDSLQKLKKKAEREERKKKYEITQEDLSEIIKEERLLSWQNNIRFDTVLFNFQFGMANKEVENHFKKLEHENKIPLWSKEGNNYTGFAELAITNTYTVKLAMITAVINNNKLIGINMKIVERDIPVDSKTFYSDLIILYKKKYGKPYMINMDNLLDFPSFHWINGNRHISIAQGTYSDNYDKFYFVSYEDSFVTTTKGDNSTHDTTIKDDI